MTVTWLAGKTKLEPSLELISVSSLQDQHRSSWHTNKGEERNQPVKTDLGKLIIVFSRYLHCYRALHNTMSDLGGSEGWWWGMLWIFPYLSTDIISNISVSVSVPALNQNINKTSVHSPYVRQALSLLSLAWITPWNGWEVFNLTWKERNVNIN